MYNSHSLLSELVETAINDAEGNLHKRRPEIIEDPAKRVRVESIDYFKITTKIKSSK